MQRNVLTTYSSQRLLVLLRPVAFLYLFCKSNPVFSSALLFQTRLLDFYQDSTIKRVHSIYRPIPVPRETV